MKRFIGTLLMAVALIGAAGAVKMSLSAKAHQHVEDFLASLQPYLNEQEVDAKNAWPWPEDSYSFVEEAKESDGVLIETSSATGGIGAASGAGAAAPTGQASGSTGSASGATGEDEGDETGVASTGATGSETGSTASTGATGATAETGSTGATGEAEEKPKEPKDATVMFDVALTGVTKAQIMSEKGMATFTSVIALKAGISKQDVMIAGAEAHDDASPVAKAHAKAKAFKDDKLKNLTASLEEEKDGKTSEEKPQPSDPNAEKKEEENAKVTADEQSAAAKTTPNTPIQFLEVGAGAIDVRFTISNIEASKAMTVATDISSFISDDSADGFASACKVKGLPVAGAKMNREPTIEGGKPKAGCAKAVMKYLNELKEKNEPESEIPARMRGFCKKSFNDRKNVLPASLSPTVIARTCERSFGIFQRRPVGKRYEAAVPESREYCYEMRQFFEYLIKKNGVTDMKHGLATSVSEINRESPGQGITACCVPHQSGGCFDKKPNKNIQECVCKGGMHSHHPSKADRFCCDTEWDLTCAENVEWYGCAACPQPEFLFRR